MDCRSLLHVVIAIATAAVIFHRCSGILRRFFIEKYKDKDDFFGISSFVIDIIVELLARY